MSDFTTWRSLVDGEEIGVIPDSAILPPEEDSLTHFSGDTGGYAINDDSPIIWDEFNELSLKKTSTSQQTIGSTSGLQNYPEPGDSFSFFVREGSGEPRSLFAWAVQDASDAVLGGSYGFRGEADNNQIVFVKDGSTVSSEPMTINSETWYDVEIEWETNGDITITVYDVDQSTGDRTGTVGSLSDNDTEYSSSGGIGLSDGGQGGTLAWDFARLTN